MYNQLMQIIRSAFLNYLLTLLWSTILILFGLSLFAQELGNENFWMAFNVCVIINLFINAFIHLLFAIGSIFWMNAPFNDLSHALQGVASILIVPSIAYAFLIGLFLTNNHGYIAYANDFAALSFIVLLIIYSLSLRGFLHQLLKFKHHEKFSE